MFDVENDVIIDTPNDTDPVVPVEPTPSADETAEEKLARLEETNKKLFERAKKAEEIARTLKGKSSLPTPKPKLDDEIVNDVKELKQIEKKRQFGYKHSLSPEETDKLFRFAGDSDPAEALKDPFFQAGLAEFRKAQRVADAIPSATNRSTLVEGKSFSEMTPEEREKNWSKITKK